MGFFENVIASKQDFVVETGATLYMVVVTSIIAGIIGMIVGLLLTLTKEGGLWENQKSIGSSIRSSTSSAPFPLLFCWR